MASLEAPLGSCSVCGGEGLLFAVPWDCCGSESHCTHCWSQVVYSSLVLPQRHVFRDTGAWAARTKALFECPTCRRECEFEGRVLLPLPATAPVHSAPLRCRWCPATVEGHLGQAVHSLYSCRGVRPWQCAMCKKRVPLLAADTSGGRELAAASALGGLFLDPGACGRRAERSWRAHCDHCQSSEYGELCGNCGWVFVREEVKARHRCRLPVLPARLREDTI